MVAIPMKLEDALRFNGYTIDQSNVDATTITVGDIGVISAPAMRLSGLTWRRTGEPVESDSFYLAALPLFSVEYQPYLLSAILDRFAARRISYNTPDDFGRAVRRWLNLHMGPTSVFNRLYASTAVALPLDTQDATIDRASTALSRDAHSDFPQGQLGGNVDYATDATDQSASATDNTTFEGRMNTSVMTLLAEQRAAFLNVDENVLAAMESLFIGVFDQGERDNHLTTPNTYAGSFFAPDW